MHLFYFLGLKQWKVMSILSGECKKNFTSLVFASLFCFFLCFNLDFVWHWSVLHCSRECTRIQGCLYPVFIHYKAGSYFLKQNKDLVWLSGSISFNSLHSGVNLLFFFTGLRLHHPDGFHWYSGPKDKHLCPSSSFAGIWSQPAFF